MVIWNVVLPWGIEAKGTLVGDTRPTVYVRDDRVSMHGINRIIPSGVDDNEPGRTRKGAKMVEPLPVVDGDGGVLAAPSSTLIRLVEVRSGSE